MYLLMVNPILNPNSSHSQKTIANPTSYPNL